VGATLTTPQPTNENELGTGNGNAASRAMAAEAARSASLAQLPLCRQTPKVRAECEKDACSDLCGGLVEIPVPTAFGVFYRSTTSVFLHEMQEDNLSHAFLKKLGVS
jgi:hypothetical protein